MSEQTALFPGSTPPVTPEPTKHTEASVLAALQRRYTESHGNGDRWAFATHVKSGAGFYDTTPGSFAYHRIADAVAMDLWPSKGLEIHGHEIKVSRSDWLAELKQPEKSWPVRRYCDRWWLVVSDRSIIKPGELPEGWGLMAIGERTGGATVEQYARVVVAAPKLKPEAISRDFIAPLLRAAVKTALRKRSL